MVWQGTVWFGRFGRAWWGVERSGRIGIMKNDYSVGIIGFGVVGQGIARLFRELVIAIYDPFVPEENIFNWLEKEGIKGNLVLNGEIEFREVDLAVVCVPTPTDKDGQSCDISYVEETLQWLEKIEYKGVVLLKSTVPPNELSRMSKDYKLRLVFSPEFMGESKYFTPFWKYPDPKDMRSHTWQVFGGNKEDTSFCIDVFKRRMMVDTQFFQTDLKTASLAKYIENCFFATKVTFVNEWFDIAQKYGVDWNELRELWLVDPRINRNHTLVFPKDRGYGGKCYPKDTKAIIADSKKAGYTPELLVSVDKVNDKMRKKNAE